MTFFRGVNVTSVVRAQILARRVDEIHQLAMQILALAINLHILFAAGRRQPAFDADVLDGRRKRFTELGISLHIDTLMRELIIGILLSGIIVGSAIATGIAAAFDIERSSLFSTMAFIGYIAATVFAALVILYTLWQLWRGRSSRR